jgi:hypothetical protein
MIAFIHSSEINHFSIASLAAIQVVEAHRYTHHHNVLHTLLLIYIFFAASSSLSNVDKPLAFLPNISSALNDKSNMFH